jgi:cold shock CspA family protein
VILDRNSNKEEKRMKKGIVIAAFPKRSYAFVHDDETGEELFAHASDFLDRTVLPVGVLVEFEVGSFKNRAKAIRIKPLLSDAASAADNYEVRESETAPSTEVQHEQR